MTIPLFPQLPGISYSVNKRPTFASIVMTAVSGREVMSPQQAFPLWEFQLTIDHMADQTQNMIPWQQYAGRYDLSETMGFFMSMAGQYGQFYFRDPSDCSRLGVPLGTKTTFSQVFTALRPMGIGGTQVLEPVGGVDQIFDIYVAGTPLSSLTYSFNGNLITINSSLTGAVTIDFSYFFLCRFIEDQLDFEEFMYNLWTLKNCKFRSVKPT